MRLNREDIEAVDRLFLGKAWPNDTSGFDAGLRFDDATYDPVAPRMSLESIASLIDRASDTAADSSSVGPIIEIGSPAISMITGSQQVGAPGFLGILARSEPETGAFIRILGEPRNGVGFDQQDGSAVDRVSEPT